MSPGLKCALCSEPIEQPASAWREQTGWAEPRTQGGVHALKGRRETGRIAHAGCVYRLATGISRDQQSFDVGAEE